MLQFVFESPWMVGICGLLLTLAAGFRCIQTGTRRSFRGAITIALLPGVALFQGDVQTRGVARIVEILGAQRRLEAHRAEVGHVNREALCGQFLDRRRAQRRLERGGLGVGADDERPLAFSHAAVPR